MATYYMNEGAFDLLELGLGFEDVTTHVLDTRHPEHGDVAVVVRRARFPADKSLRDVVQKHLEEEKARLDSYTVIEERAGEVHGAPLLEVAVRFRAEGVAHYERQAHLSLPDAWMLLAVNTNVGARASCDAWLGDMLASLRLREG